MLVVDTSYKFTSDLKIIERRLKNEQRNTTNCGISY